MIEMRKLEVLILESHVDAVLRFLGQAGAAQLIDMREKPESWKDILVPYVPKATSLARCSDMLIRIEALCKELDLKVEEPSAETPLTARESTEELLDMVEHRLAQLPLKHLAKCSAIISKADRLLATFETEHGKETAQEIPVDKSADEILAQLEHKLLEIEKASVLASLTHGKALMKKIAALSDEERIKYGEKFSVIGKFAEIGKELASVRGEAEALANSLETRTEQGNVRSELLVLYRIVKQEKQVLEVKAIFVGTEKTVYFEAWVPEAQVEEITERIKEASDGNCIVVDETPSPEDRAPTVLKPTPSYLSAFEKLTLAFGYPSASEINAVPIMMVTFSILFGIMFADVGQGAILALGGLIFTRLRRRTDLRAVGDITRYILMSGEMLVVLGISAVFFGFLFGEFFGPSGFIKPVSLGAFGPFYFGGFEPTHEPMKMLRLAVLIGVAHLTLGLVLRLANEVKKRRYKHTPIPICWLWLLIGGFTMWIHFGGISNISRWFSDGVPFLVGLFVLPLIALIVSRGMVSGFTEGIGFGVEVFAETLSHTISYSRLMALGLIHSAMSSLFLVLGGVEHGHFPISSIPVLAVGTLLVMIIEGLVVFVHDLRLHWVEWFSKFYPGEGIIFKPFKFT